MSKGRERKPAAIPDSQKHPSTNVSEITLYPLWESSRNREFPTSSGKTLFILSPGIRNHGKGPDYQNCFFLKKGRKTVYSCDVEIHVKASDWTTHQHHRNPDYGKVLLHVFLVLDTDITRLHYKNIFHIPFPNYREKREPFHLPLLQCCEGNGNFHSPEKRAVLAEMGRRKLYEKGLRIRRSFPDQTLALLAGILRVHGQTKNSKIFLDTGGKALKILLQERKVLSLEDIHIILVGSSRLLHALAERRSTKSVSHDVVLSYLGRWLELQERYTIEEISFAPWEFHGIRPQHHPFLRFLQFSLFLKSIKLTGFLNDIASGNLSLQAMNKHLVPFEKFLTQTQKIIIGEKTSPLYSRNMLELLIVDGIIPWLLATNTTYKSRLLIETLSEEACYSLKNRKTRFFHQAIPHCFKKFTFWEKQGLIRLHDEFCVFRDVSCSGCAFHPKRIFLQEKMLKNSAAIPK